MINTTRLAHGRRASIATTTPRPALSVTDRWADTLAGLAQSHRARLRAADPSRPWLNDDAASPAAGLGPDVDRAGD
jgi:hypothetical protein